MDTTQRTIVKGLTWQALGILVMTALSYPHTDSLTDAVRLAASASASGFIMFLFHERVWNRINWGRQS